MSRPVFSCLGFAVVCAAAVACSSPAEPVGKDGKAVGGQPSPNDPNGTTPPNPNHDEGNPDPGDDQGEQPTPGPNCDLKPAPIPDGWTVYSSMDFSVAAPSTDFTPDLAGKGLIQFFPVPPSTLTLGAAERFDGATMDVVVKEWTSTLLGKGGHNCTITTEATKFVCDDAIRLHAVCGNQRLDEVLLVQHGAFVYFADCGLFAPDMDTCTKFLGTLRFK